MLTWNRNLSVPSVYFIVPIKFWLMASVTLFASLEVLIGRKLDVTNVTVEPHVQRQNLLITPPMLKQKLDSQRGLFNKKVTLLGYLPMMGCVI